MSAVPTELPSITSPSADEASSAASRLAAALRLQLSAGTANGIPTSQAEDLAVVLEFLSEEWKVPG